MLWSRCIQRHCCRKKLTKKSITDKVRIKLDKEISMAVPAFRKGTRGLEFALLVIFLSYFALSRTCLAASPMPAADNAGEAFPSATSEAMPLKASIDSESKGSNPAKLNVTVDGSERMTDLRSETKIANRTEATLDEGGREKVIGDKKRTITVASMKKEEVPKPPKKKKIWSTHPAYGQRKMVKATRDLQIYVEEMSESGGAEREGRQAQEGGGADTQEVGEGVAAGERAGNRSEDGQGTGQGRPPIVIEEMELSEDEKVWINVNKVYWKDLSGKLIEQMISVCAACSDPTLFHRAMHDKELCSMQNSSTRRSTFNRCFGETPTLKACEKMRRDLLANSNRTGEMNVFAHDVHHPWPFHMPHLVRIRNAYVSSKGLVYNDDMVFDPRGKCNRGYDSDIRPEVARSTRHFKKVYVADHNFPGIHHELAEMGAQLMGYYPQLMEDKSIMIHTTGFPVSGGGYEPNKSAFKLLDFLEINGSRLVAGDVYADEVIVTHMYCWYMDWTFRVYGTRLRALMTAVAARAVNRSEGGGEKNGSSTSGIYFPMRESKPETHIPLPSPASPEDNTTVTTNSDSNSNNTVITTGKMEDLVELLLPGSKNSRNGTTQSGSNFTVTMKEKVDPLRPPVGQGTILVVKRSGRRHIDNHDELMDALRKALDEGGEEEAQAGDGGGSGSRNYGTVIGRSVGEKRDEGSSSASRMSSSALPSPSSSASSSAPSPSPSSSSSGRQRILEVYDDNLVRDTGEIWRLFMRADIVIAPHGAGLTNVLASREGTAIYEILLPFHLSWDGSALCLCYRDMSTILGLHYYSDLPTKIKIDRFEFDENQSNWVRKPLGMIIDVPKTIANVRHIFKERGWKLS